MVGGLRTVGGGQQLVLGALVLLAVCNQGFQIRETIIIRTDDDNGGLSHMVCNRCKGFNCVGSHLVDDGAGEVRKVDEADGLAIGIGIRQLGPADGTGAAFNVLDDDGLANILLSILCQDTRGVVGSGTGLVGDNHGDRAIRGKVGTGDAAEREHHHQAECKCDDLFHVSSSCLK